MKFHDICGEEHAKRAAEVALSGHHTILFIGSHLSQANSLMALVRLHEGEAFAVAPCPCGFYGDPQVPCNCIPEDIHRWRVEMYLRCPDMVVEVPNPPVAAMLIWAHQAFQSGEDHEDIVARVNHVQERYYRISQTDESAWLLLRAAMSQMPLTPQVVKNTCGVANTIAIMGNSGTIRTPHMAEALQYAPRELYKQ